MILTNEMKEAISLVENTSQCLFVSGKAGSGKTTLLRHIVATTKKKCVVTAPTGVAAINCGGATLHSFFGIPFGPQLPNMRMGGRIRRDQIELFKRLQVLIIDEISMVRPDILDYIDRKLRLYKMNEEPFGGVQVVMFGDLFQLPPVIKKDEWKMLEEFYEGEYFYYAQVWKKTAFSMVELNQVFRQEDDTFLRILNNVREYRATWSDIEDLDTIRNKRKAADYSNGHIHICTYKRDVDMINKAMLGQPTHRYDASYTEGFNEKSAPCDDILELRAGARVVLLSNDPEKRYVNGSMGYVEALDGEKVTVRLDNGHVVDIARFQWDEYEYVAAENGEIEAKVKASCTQFPLTLGWAITIHKSQGLTFDKAVLHVNKVFAPGQLYVALSRCRTLEGLITDSFISFSHIIPDVKLNAFYRAMHSRNNVFDNFTSGNLKKHESVVIKKDYD